MLKRFMTAVAGGLMVAIGGSVFLNAYLSTQTSYIGAFFFSVVFICVCMKDYGLFTGHIGSLPDDLTKDELAGASMALLGNAVATFLVGAILFRCLPKSIGLVAVSLMEAKLSASLSATLVRAVLCGVLLYLAVSIYREKNSVLGIVFCVPTYILAGFEYSVADMFYYAASGFEGGFRGFVLLILVTLGNVVGAMLLPLLTWAGKEAPQTEEAEDKPEFEVEVTVEEDAE